MQLSVPPLRCRSAVLALVAALIAAACDGRPRNFRNPKPVAASSRSSARPRQAQVAAPSSSNPSPHTYVVYDDARAAGDHLFAPSGWMPDGNSILVREDSRDGARSGTCIEIAYDASAAPWVGLYFLPNGSWGDAMGANMYEMLDVEPGKRIELSFWAQSDQAASIECKVGGVNQGAFPDSVRFARSTGYVKLSKEWTRFTVDLTKEDLKNLVGAFCVVTDRAHNPRRDEVRFRLDDIVISAVE